MIVKLQYQPEGNDEDPNPKMVTVLYDLEPRQIEIVLEEFKLYEV